MDAKFYAATQVVDEARHVEAYARLLHDKFELAYPITRPLKALLEDVIRDARWDFTYLGMQVLIEGLALAAFQQIRDFARNPLARAINPYDWPVGAEGAEGVRRDGRDRFCGHRHRGRRSSISFTSPRTWWSSGSAPR